MLLEPSTASDLSPIEHHESPITDHDEPARRRTALVKDSPMTRGADELQTHTKKYLLRRDRSDSRQYPPSKLIRREELIHGSPTYGGLASISLFFFFFLGTDPKLNEMSFTLLPLRFTAR